MSSAGRRLDATLALATSAVLSAGLVATALAPPSAGGRATAGHVQVVTTPHLTTVAASSSIDRTLTAAVRDRLSHATASGYAVVVDIADRGRVVSVHPDTRIRPASTQK